MGVRLKDEWQLCSIACIAFAILKLTCTQALTCNQTNFDLHPSSVAESQ